MRLVFKEIIVHYYLEGAFSFFLENRYVDILIGWIGCFQFFFENSMLIFLLGG